MSRLAVVGLGPIPGSGPGRQALAGLASASTDFSAEFVRDLLIVERRRCLFPGGRTPICHAACAARSTVEYRVDPQATAFPD